MNEWTMTQSATSLGISDDESKAQDLADHGKENIDPNEVSVPVTRSMSAATKVTIPKVTRKDMMTDEPRTPLGDLNPTEFYGEGLDATSVVLVHDDGAEHEQAPELPKEVAVEPVPAQDLTFDAAGKSENKLTNADIGALIRASVPTFDIAEPEPQPAAKQPVVVVAEDTAPAIFEDIEIWESESAKDENEKPEKIDDSVFALQEL